MAAFKKFEEIIAWQKARELCKIIGEFIDAGKFHNAYKLIGQIEGSTGSIMDNIAEGFERNGNREFIQHLSISKGSTGEFRSQMYRSLDRKFITSEEFQNCMERSIEISKRLQALISYLEQSGFKGSKYKTR